MDLTLADGVPRQLDRRAIPLRRVRGRITTACMALGSLAILAPIALAAPGSRTGLILAGAIWGGALLLLGILLELWPPLAFRHTSYSLDAAGLEIRRGVIWRRVICVPRSRIQHTEVSQGPLERRYGLGQVSIYTAGTTYARVTLSGIEHATALALREILQPEGGGDVV